MSSPIPHVIAFLTQPLLATFPPASVATAQLILHASLVPTTPSAMIALTATATPPAPLFAAAIGAAIPWAAWLNALSGGRNVLLSYGPGYLRVRVGDAAAADVWRADVPRLTSVAAAPFTQQAPTVARLRGALLSARMRRLATSAADSDANDSPTSDSDSESDSDGFSAYSAESRTSAASSPPATPAKAACAALPAASALYRAPKLRTTTAPRAPNTMRLAARTPQLTPQPAKKDMTAYLYQGGVTRVMTGGVMLGPRSAAHVVRSTRS